LNPYGGADIDELGHMVRYTQEGLAVTRAPSVFVSEGRFQEYMLVAFIIGLGGAGYLLLRSKPGRMVVFPGLALVILGGLMTGSRGVVVYLCASALLISAAMLWGAPPGKAASYRLVKAIRRSFGFIVVAICLLVTIFPATLLSRFQFYKETLVPTSEYSEVGLRAYAYPVQEFRSALKDPAWLIGHGTGTASLGVQYVSRILDVPKSGIAVENGFGALILEMGILGPILWTLWGASLLAAGVSTVLKLKGTWAFPIGFSIVWYAFLLLFPYTWGGLVAYQNFVNNAYFWIMVGVLFKLRELVGRSTESTPTAQDS
jgi:hypothetical protein